MARIDTTKATPGWWTENHTSNWDRVKAAFERDWEQTKADFSKSSGEKLNQNVADTVKQSLGSEPIPPLGVKTHPTDPKLAVKNEEKAREKMAHESVKAEETASKARDDIAKELRKVDAADAKRDDAASKWRDAENELRYGYSVRSQYPGNSVWNETLEATLRGEWEGLNTGISWDASRMEIHRGWDYAGKTV